METRCLLFLSIYMLLATTLMFCDCVDECPPKELLPSCTCEVPLVLPRLLLSCKDFLSVSDMRDEMKNILDKYTVYSMEIWNSVLMYLPTSLFRWIKMKQIRIYNSTIMGLEDDGSSALEPSSETLERLVLENTMGVDSWRWSAFAALRHMWTIEVRHCDMTSINRDFSEIAQGTLSQIDLSYNKIEYIDDEAFSVFKKLRFLLLYDNNVKLLKRSMFPNPAESLRVLNFGKNKLESLPKDLFTNMDKLEEVYLNHNSLRILDAATFKELLPSKLNLKLNVEGNNVYCCSHMEWLFSKSGSLSVIGKCEKPQQLFGKIIADLTLADLENSGC